MEKVKSPLTLNDNVSFIRCIKTQEIISQYKIYNINVSKYFEGLHEISLYRCDESVYRFYYPNIVAGDSIFYQHFQDFDWYYMPWKWEHEITTQYLKDGMKILEVGCAHGAFLQRVNELFDLDTSIGLELNESTPVVNKKWQIVNQYVQEFAKNHLGEFDLVCSYQVLEHISNVHSFIESNIACLKKGGKLIISVPNNDSFIKDLDAALNKPPHHMGLWTKGSLISLTKIFPIKVFKVHLEDLKSYHVDNYIWSQKYSKGNKLFNKIKRKIEILIGSYSKIKAETLENRQTIVGHTILIVFEKL